jgi:protein Mpv17
LSSQFFQVSGSDLIKLQFVSDVVVVAPLRLTLIGFCITPFLVAYLLVPSRPFPQRNLLPVIKMSGLWASYNRLLEAQPLLTKALTSLTGFTLGDILAQKFIEPGDKPYDVMRTVRLGSFGFLLHGTTGHFFYGFLDSKLPGTKPTTVATKVLIDQTMWNPIFGCMFFGYLNLVEGKSFEDYKKKLQADLKTAVMGSWAVWVPAHTINFAFVPPSQRLLYINSIQIGYNVFLSFLGNKKVEPSATDAKKEL